MPRDQWGFDEQGYMIGASDKGRLSGPWDEELAAQAALVGAAR